MTRDTGAFVPVDTDEGFTVVDERTGAVIGTGLTEQQAWDRSSGAYADFLSQRMQEAETLQVRDRVYVDLGDGDFMAIVDAAYRAVNGAMYFDVTDQSKQSYTGITPLQIRSGAPVDFGH